jgi:hypothetical protein
MRRASVTGHMLAGKWYVFWGAGVRLAGAGIRQCLRPQFTAREIFSMKTDEALPIIREHGVGISRSARRDLFRCGFPALLCRWR